MQVTASLEWLCLRMKGTLTGQFAPKLPIELATREPAWAQDEQDGVSPRWFLTNDDRLRYAATIASSEARERLVRDAKRVCQGRFDFLGTKPAEWCTPYPWHVDVRSGHRWPKTYYKMLKPRMTGQGFDVKIPWELSRFQFISVLGRAYLVTNDEQYTALAMQTIDDWISENPYLFGVNWTCAMEVSIRACNWLWVYWFFSSSRHWNTAFSYRFWNNLWLHGRFIRHNLEDSGGRRHNHYLADIVGLLFLGLMCPHFPEADEWQRFAVRELTQCMDEQVYSDGVSFENSIAYHRLVLEFFSYSAILCRRNKVTLPVPFWQRLESMFEYVKAYTFSHGRAPQFGDNDDGRFFVLEDFFGKAYWDHRYLLSVGAVLFDRPDFKAVAGFQPEARWILGDEGSRVRASLPATALPRSEGFPHGGFYFLRNDAIEVAVAAAEAGVHGTGGHKHNDNLHFDLVVRGKSILTDSGTFCYTGDPAVRKCFRSTVAHNTITVDRCEQNELEGVFRLPANQVHIAVNCWASDDDFDLLDVQHDGYTRLVQPLIHRRIFRLNKRRRRLLVVDRLRSNGEHQLTWHFHLAPGLPSTARRVNSHYWTGNWGATRFRFWMSVPFHLSSNESLHSCAYNRAVARTLFCAHSTLNAEQVVAVLSIRPK